MHAAWRPTMFMPCSFCPSKCTIHLPTHPAPNTCPAHRHHCTAAGTAARTPCAQVYLHLTVRREDGERVLETTRLCEEGVEGSGVPRAFVLGKGLRAPRGWELAISSERVHAPHGTRSARPADCWWLSVCD